MLLSHCRSLRLPLIPFASSSSLEPNSNDETRNIPACHLIEYQKTCEAGSEGIDVTRVFEPIQTLYSSPRIMPRYICKWIGVLHPDTVC